MANQNADTINFHCWKNRTTNQNFYPLCLHCSEIRVLFRPFTVYGYHQSWDFIILYPLRYQVKTRHMNSVAVTGCKVVSISSFSIVWKQKKHLFNPLILLSMPTAFTSFFLVIFPLPLRHPYRTFLLEQLVESARFDSCVNYWFFCLGWWHQLPHGFYCVMLKPSRWKLRYRSCRQTQGKLRIQQTTCVRVNRVFWKNVFVFLY